MRFQIAYLGITFSSKEFLKIHSRNVHEVKIQFHEEKVHKAEKESNNNCDFCGKSLCNPKYLKIHIRSVHHGFKDYACESCEKSFGTPQTLKIHIRTIHQGHKDYKSQQNSTIYKISL